MVTITIPRDKGKGKEHEELPVQEGANHQERQIPCPNPTADEAKSTQLHKTPTKQTKHYMPKGGSAGAIGTVGGASQEIPLCQLNEREQ